jgi:predicted signal transduction protein with EAL and GGDEF domain
MLAGLAGSFSLSRGRVAVTASIGIVKIMPPTTADRVLRDADLAMYEAKSAGRNQLAIYEGKMHVRRAQRLELETELREPWTPSSSRCTTNRSSIRAQE